MLRKLLGDAHPSVAVNLSNIAFVEYAKGRHAEAIQLLQESLDISRKALGPEHPAVGARATSLAYWLVEERRYTEAAPLVDEALAIRRKALGSEHPQTAGTLTVLANLKLDTGRYAEARDLAAEARRILLLSLPPDSWQVGAAMNTEGAALAKLADYAAAEKMLRDSLPLLGKAPIPGLEAKGRERLAQLDAARGRLDSQRAAEATSRE